MLFAAILCSFAVNNKHFLYSVVKIALTIAEFLMLALAIQGIITAIILLYTARKLSSNRWIAAIIFLISWSVLIRVVTSGMHLQDNYPWLVLLTYQPTMLIGPFIYFYTLELLNGYKKIKAKHLWHFLPALKGAGPQIGFVLFHIGLLYLRFVQSIYFFRGTQFFLFDVYIISNLPVLISLTIYAVISYRAMVKTQAQKAVSAYKVTDIKRLKSLLQLFFGLTVLFLLSIVINFGPFTNKADFINYLFFIPLIAFTYWLGLSAYLSHSKMKPDEVVVYNKVPAKVYFVDEDAVAYRQRLIDLMANEHLYLDQLLKLETLAERLKITERAFSNLLNQHIGKNFNDFVNQYRVDAAKIKLADPKFDQYTIAAIAYECGFNSLATFQRCFKQFTGITPSQYLQQRKNNHTTIQQQ